MAVFITGAGGFLGQALVNTLIEQGKEVLAFDNTAPKDEVLSRWAGKVEFHRGDIRDAKLIAGLAALSGTVDPIIHLASLFTSLIPEKAAKGEHYDIEVTPDTSYPVEYIKSVIPSASFSYKPVEDIMAVVSGYKEWTIGCDRVEKELG